MTTADRIFTLLRAFVESHDARRYSHAEHFKTLLLEAGRALPPWLEAAPLEPAAEVSRQLQCGASITLRNEDSSVVLVLRDEDTCTACAMTQEEAVELRRAMAKVMAAAVEGRAA